MQIGIIGGGVIARLILDHAQRGSLGGARIAGILGRSETSRAKPLADTFGVPFVAELDALVRLRPDLVIEAASHDAVRQHAAALLEGGISVIVLSAGALCDDALRSRLEMLAARGGATLYVPSGGIGGLDALKAACAAGVDDVEIVVTKPPAAWKNIPFVASLDVNLDRLAHPATLFEGTAREGVPHFPANVNIAAVLSLAGIGFDRTRMKVVADPTLQHNTHYINVRGRTGSIAIKLESVPSPDNPKTALLACYSAIAAVNAFQASARYGT